MNVKYSETRLTLPN